MEEISPLRKSLLESPQKPSFASLLTPPKMPSLAEQFQQAMNPLPQALLPAQEPQEKKEVEKVAQKNPKYRITEKNICKLIDKVDEQEVKIEYLTVECTSLENQTRSLQEEIKAIQKRLQEKDDHRSFFKGIDWRSFALGILVLALGAFFLIWKF